jgi:hypothetical protein
MNITDSCCRFQTDRDDIGLAFKLTWTAVELVENGKFWYSTISSNYTEDRKHSFSFILYPLSVLKLR